MSEPVAFIRPATLPDLHAFNTFAHEAGPGITSLPRNVHYLEEQLAQSERSFASQIPPNRKESYLFCLELAGRVIGTCGLVSRIGLEEPFFAYHRRLEKRRSDSLGIEREIPVLHFIEARKKPTEIGTLYLQKEHRREGLGPLLSYARFLFIALFRARFASHVIAEVRGFNQEGISPFWEGVGRHFFGLDFSKADLLRISNPEAIGELFPRHPLYTPLLALDAQEAIGRPHPRTIGAKKLLEQQGFLQSDYFDIFDAGPHLYAPTDEIHAIKESRSATVRELRSTLEGGERAFVAKKGLDFRACCTPLLIEEDRVTLSLQAGAALKVEVGEEILYYRGT